MLTVTPPTHHYVFLFPLATENAPPPPPYWKNQRLAITCKEIGDNVWYIMYNSNLGVTIDIKISMVTDFYNSANEISFAQKILRFDQYSNNYEQK